MGLVDIALMPVRLALAAIIAGGMVVVGAGMGVKCGAVKAGKAIKRSCSPKKR